MNRQEFFQGYFPNVKQFTGSEKERRLNFMKTRYTRPRCRIQDCRELAHYKFKQFNWCQSHLPVELRERLSLEWQMKHYLLPMAEYLDGQRKT